MRLPLLSFVSLAVLAVLAGTAASSAAPAAAPHVTSSAWPSFAPMPGHASSGRIVVLGDSVVSGAGITPPGRSLAQTLGDVLHRPSATVGGGGVTATLIRDLPSVPADATTVVVYAGSNDVTSAAQKSTADEARKHVAAWFAPQFDRLLHGLRARVPNAEIAVVTVRDLGRAGMHAPRITGAALTAAAAAWDAHVRNVAQELGVRAIVDTETDATWYVPAEYMPEGFHPRNAAVAKLARALATQLGAR